MADCTLERLPLAGLLDSSIPWESFELETAVNEPIAFSRSADEIAIMGGGMGMGTYKTLRIFDLTPLPPPVEEN